MNEIKNNAGITLVMLLITIIIMLILIAVVVNYTIDISLEEQSENVVENYNNKVVEQQEEINNMANILEGL